MKKILFILFTSALFATKAFAQASTVTNQPATYIPSAENATYQNNSMFQNKDNVIDMNSNQLTGNGAYVTPGFSNPINSSPNGRVQSNNERQYSITVFGYENFNLSKPVYYNEIPKVDNTPSK
ncbi:MAG: hypothetical protein EOP51_00535 [Sphingobacteriales bacterium]|nr:MAG: hypothetical protein EOP51_00535 [Sphingobacteriales bacterium]